MSTPADEIKAVTETARDLAYRQLDAQFQSSDNVDTKALGGPSVTVNAVAPGQIEESAPDIAEFDPTFVERAIKHTPAGRLVTRREVAGVVAMLCSPGFDMVTGVTLPVDGGWRLNRF